MQPMDPIPAKPAVAALRSLRGWALPVLLLAALEWTARSLGGISDAIAPPSAAATAWGRALLDGSLLASTAFTLGSAALGLLLGAAAGIALGIGLGLFKRAARYSFLSIEVLRPIPSVALIPLAMLVFGFGLGLSVSVVAFACFWPMLVLSQAAVQQVDAGLLEMSAALGLSRSAQIRKIVLPAIVPRLFVALRLGVAIALIVAVTVEIAANPNGMGYAMVIAQQSMEPALMWAWLFWIGVLGFVINAASLWLQNAVARRMGALL
jgi:sulfonate transport system permease protein